MLARRLGPALRGETSEDEALAAYAADRDRALAPIFDLTWRLAQLPPRDEFVGLQKQLNALMDAEALELAAAPAIAEAVEAAA